MSYILDALRRADDERQRHVPCTPGLTPGPTLPTATRTAPWPVIGAIIAIVLTTAVAWLWTAADAPPDPAGADIPAAATPLQQAAAASPAAPAAAPAAEPPAAPTTTAAPGPDTAMPAPPPGAAIAAVALPPPPRATAPEAAGSKPPPPPGAPAAETPSGSAVPAWRDLPPAQRQALPHPRLDVHVHASDPARRFVMIELQKYREGDTLADGSVLERIDAEGVVLEYRGQRYALPRR